MAEDNMDVDFASLLCSRLCHDLLNPIGALNNGLELLVDETDPEMRKQCMELLGDSARASAAKLKYYRLAFGSAGGYGATIPTHEVKDAVEGMFAAAGRVQVDWLVDSDALDKLAARILLNLGLIAGEALPRGGTLTLALERGDDAIDIAVRGEGPRLTLDTELRHALTGQLPADAISSRSAAAAMIHHQVTVHGGDILLSDADQPFLLLGVHLPNQA